MTLKHAMFIHTLAFMQFRRHLKSERNRDLEECFLSKRVWGKKYAEKVKYSRKNGLDTYHEFRTQESITQPEKEIGEDTPEPEVAEESIEEKLDRIKFMIQIDSTNSIEKLDDICDQNLSLELFFS